ncbi:hypothetical protein C8F01DRAFT_1080811 [Mycena amicta]|nr:hypothetical protein C8F01DRAFT_1080811 [Mycena amicta]
MEKSIEVGGQAELHRAVTDSLRGEYRRARHNKGASGHNQLVRRRVSEVEEHCVRREEPDTKSGVTNPTRSLDRGSDSTQSQNLGKAGTLARTFGGLPIVKSGWFKGQYREGYRERCIETGEKLEAGQGQVE